MNEFIAVDVETANEHQWSICQVGLAYFSDGKLVDTWSSLVNPKTNFRGVNIGIHGITKDNVEDAPCLDEIYEIVAEKIGNSIVAHHMPFDRIAFYKCALKTGKKPLECRWVDTASIARQTWEEVRQRGYGLEDLAKRFDIQFEHHDALEDAKAAGLILLRASSASDQPFDKWIKRFCVKSDPGSSPIAGARLYAGVTEEEYRKLVIQKSVSETPILKEKKKTPVKFVKPEFAAKPKPRMTFWRAFFGIFLLLIYIGIVRDSKSSSDIFLFSTVLLPPTVLLLWPWLNRIFRWATAAISRLRSSQKSNWD